MTEDTVEAKKEPEIIKLKIRHRYPWLDLTLVGDQFTIPLSNKSGVSNARQLCYAATKASQRNGSPKVFKAFKQPDGSVVVKYVM